MTPESILGLGLDNDILTHLFNLCLTHYFNH